MNFRILIGIFFGAGVIIGGWYLLRDDASPEDVSGCAQICQEAYQACPSLVSVDVCQERCSELSDEARDHLAQSESCLELSSKPELLTDILIPQIPTPESPDQPDTNACERACSNYTSKCLTLVPNATQALFDEGFASCMTECEGWDDDKVSCMVDAPQCESMTDVCGL